MPGSQYANALVASVAARLGIAVPDGTAQVLDSWLGDVIAAAIEKARKDDTTLVEAMHVVDALKDMRAAATPPPS